jgi:hypothetical protein
VHCGPGPIPLFLKERQSLQSRTDPGTLGGASSNIRPRESGTSRAHALRIESLRGKGDITARERGHSEYCERKNRPF